MNRREKDDQEIALFSQRCLSVSLSHKCLAHDLIRKFYPKYPDWVRSRVESQFRGDKSLILT